MLNFLKKGSLNASIPAPVLNNSTGNNVTLSGVTNINSANVSGALNAAGAVTFSGNLNVTGNSIFNGTINATGNKTFSGSFSQSGASTFIGNFGQSGTLVSTGTWNHTGILNQTGAAFFKGSVIIDSTDASTTISGSNSQFNVITNFGVSGILNVTGSCNISGALHAINGNIIHTGSFNHSGATILLGETRNTGDFAVVGTSTLSGRVSAPSGITTSGNITSPSLVLNRNLTTSPSGGAIEYGNDGRFYFSNGISGAPNRSVLNQVYSIASSSASNSITLSNTGTFYPILNSTGIYLTTGTYKLAYNVNFGNTGTANYIRLGIFSSGNSVFSKRHGLAYKRWVANSSTVGYGFNITGSGYNSGSVNIFGTNRSDETYVYGNPYGDASSLYIDTNHANYLNNFIFDCVVTLTGNAKVFPVVNPSAAAMGNIIIREFNMQITQLTTGTGVGLASASGPWSNA